MGTVAFDLYMAPAAYKTRWQLSGLQTGKGEERAFLSSPFHFQPTLTASFLCTLLFSVCRQKILVIIIQDLEAVIGAVEPVEKPFRPHNPGKNLFTSACEQAGGKVKAVFFIPQAVKCCGVECEGKVENFSVNGPGYF